MYKNLRTNIPKEIMGFREFPFLSDAIADSYVGHERVQAYLEEYTNHFDLRKHIKFSSPVLDVSYLRAAADTGVDADAEADGDGDGDAHTRTNRKFKVTYDSPSTYSTFDLVIVCSGHFSVPNLPRLDNLEKFRGRVMHSVEYDSSEDFVGEKKSVLCIGGSASGSDIAKEISAVAPCFLSMGGGNPKALTGKKNIITVPRTTRISDDGKSVNFEDTEYEIKTDEISTIVFCTGFEVREFLNM